MDEKLQFVDELARGDHSFVRPQDSCFYLLEYTKVPEGRKSWELGPTNNLISNFKKKPDRRGLPEWSHKARAIREIGTRLQRATVATFPTFFEFATLVPIPGSKCRTDLEYDPRMLEALQVTCAGVPGADLRELLVQTRSLPRAHESEVRPTINDIAACCAVNETVAAPEPQVIVLFIVGVVIGHLPPARQPAAASSAASSSWRSRRRTGWPGRRRRGSTGR